MEIHTQFAPFRLDMLKPAYWTQASRAAGRRPGMVSGKGLGQIAAGSLARQPADGPEAWRRESDDIRASVRWAQARLAGHLTA